MQYGREELHAPATAERSARALGPAKRVSHARVESVEVERAAPLQAIRERTRDAAQRLGARSLLTGAKASTLKIGTRFRTGGKADE